MLSKIGARRRGTLRRFWRSDLPPGCGDSPKAVLAARALRITLVGLLVWLVVQFGLMIPFFVVRKAASLVFSLVLLLSVLVSLYQFQRGRVKLASWVVVSSFWLLLTADVVLSGGLSSHAVAGLLSVTVITAWLFEYEVTLIAAGLFLGTTLGLALLETTGGVLPRYFPDPPLVVWSLLCLYLAVTTLPLSLVLRALNQTLGVASQRATFNQAVRDSLTAHIAVIDATGVIISTNRAWDRFAIENGGSSPQKYGLGANYLDACAQAASGEDLVARQVLAGLQAVQDGVQDCFDIEYPCDSPSEKRWFAMHATRLGGGGRALVVSHQNITDRKRAQEEMGGSQALLRAVLDGTPDLMFLKDRQSRIVLANPATLHVIGKPAEEVLGKTDLEFYDDPEIGRPIMENDRRIMETGRAESMEETVPTPGGTRIFLSTKSPYFDANGRIIGIIGMASDITERKRAEQKILEHMQELERWRKATLGREDRVLELKREINRLLAQLGEPPRYTGGLTEP